MTTEQKLDILTQDFLERDASNHFVKIRRTGRLGWESILPQESAYSEYMLHPDSKEDLIKNAYRLACDTLTVMDTPHKVNVRITPDRSCTDSQTVWVATQVFDDADLSVGRKLDTFLGLTVHEGCHLLYTDFTRPTDNDLVRNLDNIIEDERIERECGESKPGLANFLTASKYYYFDKYRQEMQRSGDLNDLDTIQRLMNCILAYIRYPKALDVNDLREFADVMLGVKEILTPYPQCSQDVREAAEKIYELIKQFVKENPQQQQQQGGGEGSEGNDGQQSPSNGGGEAPQQQQQQGGGEGSEGNDGQQSPSNGGGEAPQQPSGNGDKDEASQQPSGNGDKDEAPQQPSGNGDKDEASQQPSGDGDDGAQGADGNDGGSKPSNGGAKKTAQKKAAPKPLSDKEAEQKISASIAAMQKALDNIASEPRKGGLGDSEQSETVKEDEGRVGAVCEGRLERGLSKGSYIEKAKENKTVYEDSLNRVKRYIPAISRALKCSSTAYRLSLRGMRSGVLDTGKLAEAFQGVPTVYTREGEVRTDRVSVCILIDESGSMWGSGEQAARDTAVLLNEALGTLPNVDLYIYGHTASRSTTTLYVYREGRTFKKHALGSTDSRNGNHDSVAIREAAARVRKHTKEKCLFFMISDGAPNESPALVKKAVKEVEKDGFGVVAVSIDPMYNPATMYDRNVTLSDLPSLAIELGKLVKKAVADNTKKHLTI